MASSEPEARTLPRGTVTFVFTDVEGSTRMAARAPDGFRHAMRDHNRILRAALDAAGGVEVRTEGDSFFAAFSSAAAAVEFGVDAQRRLVAHDWPQACEVRVRIGMHTGTAVLADHDLDDYVGLPVHRAARIEGAAHGGQVLVSATTKALAEHDLPEVGFRDLGEHRLKDIADPERLYQVTGPGLRSEFPPLTGVDEVPNNLPPDLSTFVKRDDALAAARDALDGSRLVTLTGPGGTGKTRLSVELARAVMGDYPDGVFFVDLAGLEDPALLASQLLTAIGLQVPAGIHPEDHVREYLRGRRMLLVLDNFEQILDAASFVAEMLRESGDVKVVVTSRAALHVTGEQEVPVPALSLPPNGSADPESLMEYGAVRLFIERARMVRPDFALDAANAATVARLVTRLDGLPLAIELAAVRAKAFPVDAILDRIDRGILEGAGRDLPERQRSLAGAIDWSYRLLSEPCRRLFDRLGVFAGGASLDQIEVVCGPSDDLGGDLFGALGELVDQSLVRAPPPGEDRYRMLAVIRRFAMERLVESGAAGEIHRRHVVAFRELAEEAAPQLVRVGQKAWLDRIADDHDNIRVALAWATENGMDDEAYRIVGAVWRFWQIRGHLIEGTERVAEVLRLEPSDPKLRIGVLEAAGGLGYWRGDREFAGYYREAVDVARAVGDRAALANALYNLSFAKALEDADEALRDLDEAEAIYREAGDRAGVGRVLWGRGNVLVASGSLKEGADAFTASVDAFADTDFLFDRAWATFSLAFARLQYGDGRDVDEILSESLSMFLAADDVSGVVMHLAGFAAAALAKGEPARAYRLVGAKDALQRLTGFGLVDARENQFLGITMDDIEALEGADRAAYEHGLTLSRDEAVAYALREMDFEGDHR